MKDIILHIGMHKTATTTLQHQVFPVCKDLNYLAGNDEINRFVHEATTIDPIYYDSEYNRSRVMPYIKENMPNLISKEALSGPMYAGVGKAGLDHRLPVLMNIAKTIPKTKVLLVIRRQDTLARSFYRQYLKVGGVETIKNFYGLNGEKSAIMPLNRFRFLPYIEKLNELFPEGVLILTFEEFTKNQSAFIGKLSQFLGVELPNLKLRSSNQTRLSPTGMEFSRVCNRFFRSRLNPAGLIPGVPKIKARKYIWANPNVLLHTHWPAYKKTDNQSQLYKVGQEILKRFEDDNRLLDEKYDIELKKYGYY